MSKTNQKQSLLADFKINGAARAAMSHSTALRGQWLTMPQYFKNTALMLCKAYRLALSGVADQDDVNN